MKDIISGVGSGVAERMSNPLGISFVISWVIINYRFFIVLFSEMDVLEKFSYFESVHFHEWGAIFYGVLYPFVAAVAYVFAFPHVSKFVYRYWAEQQNRIRGVMADAEGTSPILQEQWKTERLQFRGEVDRLQKELDEKTLQVIKVRDIEIERDKLKADLVKKSQELVSIQDANDELRISLNSFEEERVKLDEIMNAVAATESENARLNASLRFAFDENERLKLMLMENKKDGRAARMAGASIRQSIVQKNPDED